MAARLIHNFVSNTISLLYAAFYACVTKTFLTLGFCILGILNALGRVNLLLPDDRFVLFHLNSSCDSIPSHAGRALLIMLKMA
jgi:hypothetical protein